MIIQIDGTNTLNKGAELMLVAIVEQIEKFHPNAKVVYNSNYSGEKKPDIKTKIVMKKRFWLKNSRIPIAILSRLGFSYTFFTSKHVTKGVDLVLDAAGFQFSDQWNYSDERLNTLNNYFKVLKENNSKIVLLSQAFGPFDTKSGENSVKIINKYADVIIAREKVSYKYLIDAGAEKSKVWQYPDFTLLVEGILPEKYNFTKGKICIIPNKKMVTHTSAGSIEYLEFLKKVILEFKSLGKDVFLLNHEGEGDLNICKQISSKIKNKICIVSGLNAKEVKGVIGASFMTVSSRFHGVASALSQGVPCLATSWNHKYKMLFEDYDQFDKIINIEDIWSETQLKIHKTFKNHTEIRAILNSKKEELSIEIKSMWEQIWKNQFT